MYDDEGDRLSLIIRRRKARLPPKESKMKWQVEGAGRCWKAGWEGLTDCTGAGTAETGAGAGFDDSAPP